VNLGSFGNGAGHDRKRAALLHIDPDIEIFDLRGPILRERDLAACADRPTRIGRRRVKNRSKPCRGYIVRGMGERDAARSEEQNPIDGVANTRLTFVLPLVTNNIVAAKFGNVETLAMSAEGQQRTLR
jgi:hypothetical protein